MYAVHHRDHNALLAGGGDGLPVSRRELQLPAISRHLRREVLPTNVDVDRRVGRIRGGERPAQQAVILRLGDIHVTIVEHRRGNGHGRRGKGDIEIHRLGHGVTVAILGGDNDLVSHRRIERLQRPRWQLNRPHACISDICGIGHAVDVNLHLDVLIGPANPCLPGQQQRTGGLGDVKHAVAKQAWGGR